MTGMGGDLDGAGIAKGSAPVFDPVADGHDGGLTKPGFGLIFNRIQKFPAAAMLVKIKKIDAVVLSAGDYLSI